MQNHDGNYGNIWTNIDRSTFGQLGVELGEPVQVRFVHEDKVVLDLTLPYVTTFGEVEIGKPLLYLNSLDNVSLGINQQNFAERYQVGSGPD